MKLIETLKRLRDDAKATYEKDVKVEGAKNIPARDDIPLLSNIWIRLDDVTCVYADMMHSTQLSVRREPNTVARMYELFTANAVRILNEFGAEYVDVRGDGAFGLFTDRAGLYKAFAAAVTIKTFTNDYAAPIVKSSGLEFALTSHIGMQSGRLLVKRIGLRGDMQNEVWAGRPVNVAAKLASRGAGNQLVVSAPVYDRFQSDLIYSSCGCRWEGGNRISGSSTPLWEAIEVDPAIFGSAKAHILKSSWCPEHGEATCNGILAL